MVSIEQIRGLVASTLKGIGSKFMSKSAVDLVVTTGMVESRYKYLRQLGDGPARSFWQVEPATAVDNCQHYLIHRIDLMRDCAATSLVDIKYWQTDDTETCGKILETNIAAGIVHCRIKYWRVPKKLPSSIEGMASYWKEWYNTHQGAGHAEDFIEVAKKYL